MGDAEFVVRGDSRPESPIGFRHREGVPEGRGNHFSNLHWTYLNKVEDWPCFRMGIRAEGEPPYVPPVILARIEEFLVGLSGHYRRWSSLGPTDPPDDSPAFECLPQIRCQWPLLPRAAV